jgi:hypothetical protein
MWLVGLASAFGIKLSSSIDDVVWLAPFLTANSSVSVRFQNSIIYTSVCLCQTMVAMIIAYSGRKAVKAIAGDSKDVWSTEKILTVSAGCLLTLYSIKLTHEWCTEEPEEGENEGAIADQEGGSYGKVPTSEGAADGDIEMAGGKPGSARSKDIAAGMVPGVEIDSPDKAQEEIEKKDKERQQTLFVIAFIGSVDDLTLFVPMLVGKGFDIVQLMLGAFLATVVILTFCICIGLCKPIADCLSKIPLAAIVIVFATVLLLKGFVFDEDNPHSH